MLTELANQLRTRAIEFTQTESAIEIVQYSPNVTYYVIPWAADPSVPVLYFMVYDESYTPIRDLDAAIQTIKADCDAAPYISHAEHPLNNLPCFFLHPCNTKALIGQLDSGEAMFLWLSGIGSKVGLRTF